MPKGPAWPYPKPFEKDVAVFERREELIKEKIEKVREGKKPDHIVMRELDVRKSYSTVKDGRKGAFQYHSVFSYFLINLAIEKK